VVPVAARAPALLRLDHGVIEFRTLGVATLRDADRGTINAPLAWPKRLALLAYLAIAAPDGFQRRDKLVALFWPELDQGRARSALRSALHALRRTIGPEVIVTRGDDEVGLRTAALWCDVWDFERLIAARRHKEALELYGGPLLDGLFVPDAPGFEGWLDERRSSLRRQAATAAWRIYDHVRVTASPGEALQWARGAVAIDRDDEAGVRMLIAALDGAGERVAALRAYDELATRLRREYDAEPATETRDLVQRIRTRRAEQRPTINPIDNPPPLAVAGRGLPEILDEPAGEVLRLTPAGPTSLRSRYLVAIAVTMFAVAVVVAAATIQAIRISAAAVASHATAPADSLAGDQWTRIVVLPLATPGAGRDAPMLAGLADLLAEKLDGASTVQAVGPAGSGSLATVARFRSVAGGRSIWRAALRSAGAAGYISGSVLEAGGRSAIVVTLYRPDGEIWMSTTATAASSADLFAATDDVARAVLATVLDAPGSEIAAAGGHGTTSLKAYRAYLGGVHDLRHARAAAAGRGFARAVELDSTFAFAHWGLSLALASLHHDDSARAERRVAAGLAESLMPADAMLIRARLPLDSGDVRGAIDRYRRLLGQYPDATEARLRYGLLIIHYGPFVGVPLDDATPLLRSVLARDPYRREALCYLAFAAVRHGRLATADSLGRRLLTVLPPGEEAARIRALLAFAHPDTAARRASLRELAELSDDALVAAASEEARLADDVSAVATIASLLDQPTRATATRARGRLYLAGALAARGQWSASDAELARARALDPALVDEYASLWALGAPPTAADLARGVQSSPATERELSTLERALSTPFDPRRPPESSLTATRTPTRLRYAELLASTGRDSEAAHWLPSVVSLSGLDIIFLGPVWLQLGTVDERLGHVTAARDAYSHVVALWATGDAAVQPAVEFANVRLRALAGQADAVPRNDTVARAPSP
jgi:DNA-binding SARP family transcriptional activator/tetratricopeptide (TPR) repeat protein